MSNIKKILLYQVLTAIVLTGIGLLFEFFIAMSLLLGSTISAVGTGILALGVFSKHRSPNPEFMLQRFYMAEFLKIFVVILAFMLIFIFGKKIVPLAILGAYFIAQSFPTALASLQDDKF